MNKTLALNSKKTVIWLLFFFNLAAIFSLWLRGSFSLLANEGLAGRLIAAGRLSGLLAEFFLLLQLIFVGRVSWLEQQFGHDKFNAAHRFIGYALVIFLLSHPLLLSIGYGQLSEQTAWAQFVSFLTNWEDVFKAFIAVILFFALIGMSVAIIKNRLRYETWHFAHLLMYVAIALAFGHQINTGDMSSGGALYYWLALNFICFGLLLIYRFLRPLWNFAYHRFRVQRVVQESPDIWSVYLTGRHLDKFHFQAGQFANLLFWQKGLKSSHPFSFSAAPNGQFLRFSIKNFGDFSSQINRLQPGTKVSVDGPLGVMIAKRARTKKFLLLAGGIGITPLLALAQELSARQLETTLIYACKTANDLAFKTDLANLKIKSYYLLSQETSTEQNYLSGRLDKDKLLQLVPDVSERDVYLCGPLPMMLSIQEILKTAGVKTSQIHWENFAY